MQSQTSAPSNEGTGPSTALVDSFSDEVVYQDIDEMNVVWQVLNPEVSQRKKCVYTGCENTPRMFSKKKFYGDYRPTCGPCWEDNRKMRDIDSSLITSTQKLHCTARSLQVMAGKDKTKGKTWQTHHENSGIWPFRPTDIRWLKKRAEYFEKAKYGTKLEKDILRDYETIFRRAANELIGSTVSAASMSGTSTKDHSASELHSGGKRLAPILPASGRSVPLIQYSQTSTSNETAQIAAATPLGITPVLRYAGLLDTPRTQNAQVPSSSSRLMLQPAARGTMGPPEHYGGLLAGDHSILPGQPSDHTFSTYGQNFAAQFPTYHSSNASAFPAAYHQHGPIHLQGQPNLPQFPSDLPQQSMHPDTMDSYDYPSMPQAEGSSDGGAFLSGEGGGHYNQSYTGYHQGWNHDMDMGQNQ